MWLDQIGVQSAHINAMNSGLVFTQYTKSTVIGHEHRINAFCMTLCIEHSHVWLLGLLMSMELGRSENNHDQQTTINKRNTIFLNPKEVIDDHRTHKAINND